MQKKTSVISLLPAILSLFLSLGTSTVFHACERKDDGTWMHCHNAQNAVTFAGLILLVVFLAGAWIRIKPFQTGAYALGLVGSVILFLIPGKLVSMCMMNTMRCYVVMQPFARVMAALILIVSAICLIQSWKVVRK